MIMLHVKRYFHGDGGASNRAIETAHAIEELIEPAKRMRTASARGEELNLSGDELAFYDALETNDSAVKVLVEPAIALIARELVATVRQNVTIDCARTSSRIVHLRVLSPARRPGTSSRNPSSD